MSTVKESKKMDKKETFGLQLRKKHQKKHTDAKS